MKYVSTAELKAKLSHYLSVVKEGQSVIVTSHHTPIAELVPMKNPDTLDIVKPEAPLSSLRTISGIHKGPLPSESFLNEDRGRR
ncbi:MAG: type II toxin-antitoxin system Phd/YefM family antitoxin [Kiritimatiellia bacterium]